MGWRETYDAVAEVLAHPSGVDRRSPVIVLHGCVGAGKTWLLDSLAERDLPAPVLRATGHEAEARIAYAGLHELVAPVLERPGPVAEPAVVTLRAALRIDPSGSATLRPIAVATALLDLLRGLARAGGAALVVDDVQWLDEATMSCLVFALRRLNDQRIVTVLAARTDAGPGSAALLERLAGVATALYQVGDWSEFESRALLRELYPGLTRSAVDRVVRLGEGTPLALVELGAALLGESAVAAPTSTMALPGLGRRMDAYFGLRLAALDRRQRLALLVLSLDDLPPRLAEAALTSVGLGLTDVAPAEEHGLLRLTGDDRVRFRHPLVRAAVGARASRSELRTAHLGLARTLAASDPARAAWHRFAAGGGAADEPLATALARAADTALDSGAVFEAVQALAAAWSVSAEPDTRRDRATRTAELASRQGRLDIAGAVAYAMAAESQTASERAGWLRVLLARDFLTGSADCLPSCAGVVDELAAESPVLAAELLGAEAGCLYSLGRLTEAERRLARLAELLEAAGGAQTTWETRLLCDIIRASRADVDSVRALASPWWRALDDTRLLRSAYLLMPAVATLLAAGAADAAEELVERLEQACHAAGGAGIDVVPTTLRCVLDIEQGAWDDASRVIAIAEDLYGSGEFIVPIAHLQVRFAALLVHRGQYAEATRRIALVRRVAGRIPTIALLALSVCGLQDMLQGRLTEAVCSLTEGQQVARSLGTALHGTTTVGTDLVEALWRRRRFDEARTAADAFWRRSRTDPNPDVRAAAWRCRGLVADGEASSRQAFEVALRLHARGSNILARARTMLCYGIVLRRRRRKGVAREHLDRALALFRSLGATPWVAATEAELAACGRRRAAQEGVAGVLTPGQWSVARAVADNLSNREVAERLSLSVRTVEYHLANAYRLLGVANRAELTALVRARSGEPTSRAGVLSGNVGGSVDAAGHRTSLAVDAHSR